MTKAVERAVIKFGEDLRGWRHLRGLTTEDLAGRAGVSQSTIQRLERGEGGISLASTFEILRSLGVLEIVTDPLDPLRSDIGRLRAHELQGKRVRRRKSEA